MQKGVQANVIGRERPVLGLDSFSQKLVVDTFDAFFVPFDDLISGTELLPRPHAFFDGLIFLAPTKPNVMNDFWDLRFVCDIFVGCAMRLHLLIGKGVFQELKVFL